MNGTKKGWNIMSKNGKIFYQPRTLSPKERVEMMNLRAENAELKQIIKDQTAALIQLAELLEKEKEVADNG